MSGSSTLNFTPTSAQTPGDTQSFSATPGYIRNYPFGSEEWRLKSTAADVTSRFSNLGSVVPRKGPTARSLFAHAAKYGSTYGKYNQFLFYSFSNNTNTFREEYYQSENAQFNGRISPLESKNPSAGALIKATQQFIFQKTPNDKNDSGPAENTVAPSPIVGGIAAPYFWSDFLYCKYYGSIPNNYMITLRRYPAPMRDNLDIPKQLKYSSMYEQGVGRPVAQAVTWWGGQTGNTLSSIISFSTGLEWETKFQDEISDNQGFDQGFFKTVVGRSLGSAAEGLAGSIGLDLLTDLGDVLTVLAASSAGGNAAITMAKVNQALRDKFTQANGPLSDFIFAPVDTVDKTYIRGRGLSFSSGDYGGISLKFHYELTSLGEVNTKAAMVDIIGNLLALGTNYGNFLTPDVRYDNTFPAIGFPGGDEGLRNFYADPLEWTKTALMYLADPNGTTMSDPQNPLFQQFQSFTNRIEGQVKQLQNALTQAPTGDKLKTIKDQIEGPLGNILAFALSDDLIEKIQVPLSLKTGAPVGEWHLVVGNPMNPIAMIGNLICSNVTIDFGEVLGPDDFPTEITATFELDHGRDRDRGEIESMFNRGDGRLYQSTLPTYANTQSVASSADVAGRNVAVSNTDPTQANPFQLISGTSSGGQQNSATFNVIPPILQNR